VAAGRAVHIPRIRRLYPFLQAHNRWALLAQIDSSTSYATADAASAMMEAYMNLNRLDELGNRIGAVLNGWPAEPRLIYPLFFLAQTRANWQPRFKEYLLHYVQSSVNPHVLAELIEPCLILRRPDLAWQVCRRLRTLDPHHPALAMTVAQYGHVWFNPTLTSSPISCWHTPSRAMRPLPKAYPSARSWPGLISGPCGFKNCRKRCRSLKAARRPEPFRLRSASNMRMR
jgi:hypothetical protein